MDYVYMNEDSIERLLKCNICLKPFIDPVITTDGDRFCRLCVIKKSSNFNRQTSFIEKLIPAEEKLLINMLDSLPVKCLDCQQINIRRGDFQEHRLNKCSKRIVLCKACDLKCPWTGSYDEYDEHVNNCTFELLRPILNETLQCQKQLEEYKICSNKQQNEIDELKKQIEQYEDRTEKLQKGFRAFLEINFQQKLRYEKFYNDLQEIHERFNRQNQFENEIEQMKEQFNRISILLDQFQQSKTELPDHIQQIKEQFNQYELEIKKFQELELNINKQIKQFQRQEQQRTNEIIHIRQVSDQHQVQINLLARKKCVIPAPIRSTDPNIRDLIETFKPNSEIDLNGKPFDTQDMDLICKTAIVNKQCRKLHLENNGINAKGITILTDSLYGNKTLVELHLSNNFISDMGVHALAQVLSIGNFTLETLVIHSNYITDEGAEYLADMLKTNKTLILLGLNLNQISDRGVCSLASTISYYNETIQWLHLASNKAITDASVDNLIEMLACNRSLQGVWLNDCSLSSNAVKKLKQAVQSKKDFILQV